MEINAISLFTETMEMGQLILKSFHEKTHPLEQQYMLVSYFCTLKLTDLTMVYCNIITYQSSYSKTTPEI